MENEFTVLDRTLLNAVQQSFPLTEEPFAVLGAPLGLSGDAVVEKLAAMKRLNVLREISAIFDSRRLGYQSCLVAMRFPEDRLTEAALRINAYPGVSHNYARDAYFNLWFTVAVGPGESLEGIVAALAVQTMPERYRLLPALRTFKIGVMFDMVAEEGASQLDSAQGSPENASLLEPLSLEERDLVRLLQEDLPLIPHPFAPVAKTLGLTQSQLFAHLDDLKRRGILRRFGGVLRHRRAGFKGNGMAVWRVPCQDAERIGMIMATHPAVSHCYQRLTYAEWPYSHFTMVHATSKERCLEIVRDIASQTGITEYQVFFSHREFKKTRVRYFTGKGAPCLPTTPSSWTSKVAVASS